MERMKILRAFKDENPYLVILSLIVSNILALILKVTPPWPMDLYYGVLIALLLKSG
jgi:hypothetical protein